MSRPRLRYYVAAAVSLLTFAVYLPALRNDFVNWDDMVYVVNNLHLRSLDGSFFRWAFSDMSVSYWHPVAWISHALDYAVWGLHPAGHHLTSILLHVVNTFLVVVLVIRLVEAANTPLPGGDRASTPPSRLDGRAMLMTGAVTGILFGIHPLHVESAAWISERKDLLCAFFTLLSIMAYTSAVAAPDREVEDNDPRPVYLRRPYVLSFLFFVLALLSKPMAVTVPAVLLILDWHPFDRIRSFRALQTSFLEKVPFLLVSLAMAMVAVSGQRAQGALVPLEGSSLPARMLGAAHALAFYLGKMALPLRLSPLYPDTASTSAFSFGSLAALALVCGITAACAVTIKKQRALAAAWAYYVITLLPVLGLVKIGTATVADRFTYLPSLGLFLLVGLGVSQSWARTDPLDRGGTIVKGFMAAAAVCLVIVLSWATLKQISVWKDSITLWSAVVESEPDRVPLAYNNRGDAFRETGQLDRALEDYTTTIALEPSFAPMSYVNRGIVFERMGRADQAIADFTAAIGLNPRFANAFVSRGFVFLQTGQLDHAIEDLDKAITIDPSSADAFLNRGVAYERQGRFERALADYGRAIELDPWDHLAYCNRGKVLAALGRVPEAIGDQTKALSLKPDLVQAYMDRGDLYRKAGKEVLAHEDYQRACGLGSESGCAAARAR